MVCRVASVRVAFVFLRVCAFVFVSTCFRMRVCVGWCTWLGLRICLVVRGFVVCVAVRLCVCIAFACVCVCVCVSCCACLCRL